MVIGAFTRYIDVAQVVLYVFWIFFAGLVFYLRREDKREGYPLESTEGRPIRVQGYPGLAASPKVFLARTGGTAENPSLQPPPYELKAVPTSLAPGAPLQPTGDPMIDAVGPASYAQRRDVPDVTVDGAPKIVPMRVATDVYVAHEDPDPRGWDVVGLDGEIGGTLSDLWIDRSELQIRYLEVSVAGGTRSVLLPIPLVRFDAGRRQVKVASIPGARFATVPGTRNPNVVTFLEEDKISAYYSSGHLYGTPSRFGPLV
jgi:photosynthetic reaction center H subunit